MKKIIILLVVALVAFIAYKGPSGFVGLLSMSRTAQEASEKQKDVLGQAVAKNGQKVLVAYFSWGGNTRKVACKIHELVGGDLYEIKPQVPYPDKYKQAVEVVKIEKSQNLRPAIAGKLPELKNYDVIILGYPIWWHIEPMIVKTFVESTDLKGKVILPFATSGSSDVKESVEDLRKTLPDVEVRDGLLANISAKIKPWLEENKMLK